MKTYDNTFKLNPKYTQLYVPYSGEVITANSPDALVIEFLTQENGKYFETRKATFFEKLPDGITEEGKVVVLEKDEVVDIEKEMIRPDTTSSLETFNKEDKTKKRNRQKSTQKK